jgi:hypothetical protein
MHVESLKFSEGNLYLLLIYFETKKVKKTFFKFTNIHIKDHFKPEFNKHFFKIKLISRMVNKCSIIVVVLCLIGNSFINLNTFIQKI